MSFLILVALLVALWLLWTISRNTADALDKQTAVQYEIIALEKRMEELSDSLKGKANDASRPARRSSSTRNKKEADSDRKESAKKESE